MNNQRRSTFFTSDWHINEPNIINYSKRPFTDIEHQNEILINNFNSCVPENGICYFLGDMGKNPTDIKKVLDQLNVKTMVLISGNHDKKNNAMYNAGFDVVLNSARIDIAGQQVTLSHCPLRGVFREDVTGMRGAVEGENWHKETKHGYKFSVTNEGQFHLAGHTHSPNSGKSEVKLNRQWDIGLDGNNFRPVSISKVESWIAETLRKESNK